MTLQVTGQSINIRPGVSILSVLRHLNYKPWYAISEFVDNAVQSYLDCRDDLRRAAGGDYTLRVEVMIDPVDDGTITIRDNAGGIHEQDYDRAFRAAAIPLERDGLSEFGMGMKSAACWFAKKWRVRTKALGETIERDVSFDIETIVQQGKEVLEVMTRNAKAEAHFTEITLWDLHNKPQGRTLAKIKEHLCSIYRMFLREDELELVFNGERLDYDEPPALVAPYYKTPNHPPVEWEKQVDIDLGQGKAIQGWAALRETASTSHAGFALFRRRRLIQGSADEGYRPAQIFKTSNSYTYQRLFGELNIEGFGVSHTKDGIQWEDTEDRFLALLKEQLDAQPVPLVDQAEGFRVKRKPEEYRTGAQIAVQKTAETLQRYVTPVLEHQVTVPPPTPPTPPPVLPPATVVAHRVIQTVVDSRPWEIAIELAADPAIGPWVDYSDEQAVTETADPTKPRKINVRIAMAHPFMERFGGTTSWDLEPLIRLAVAVVLGEITARTAGTRYAGRVRFHINELLRDALSQP